MSVKMEASIDKAKSDAALAFRHLEDKIKRDNGLLAAEVTHVRLRFTQMKLSRRWMLVTQFDDNFMQYARDLRGATEVIVRSLTGDMMRHLTQLDFSRMKPVDFDADRHPIYEMKFFQEGKDPWS